VTKSLEIDPKNDGSLETRAEIYEKLGKTDEAIADYRASLALMKNRKTAIDGLERLGAMSCSRPGLVVTALPASHGLPAYPKESLSGHEEGATIVRVTIGPDGAAADVAVDQSSGSERLDNAFVEKVKSTYRWQPPTRDCKPVTAEAHLRLAVHLIQVRAVPPEAEFHVTMPASSYPPGAAAKLEWGETLLEITTDGRGAIQDGRVIRTSEFADLDEQALAIVKRSPELMKGTAAGKHILAAAWHLPAGIFPPDYEMLEMTAMQITGSAPGPGP
jgi:TonB family protein